MGHASRPAPRPELAIRPGLTLYRMADGSGVLADLDRGEGHALNAEAAELLGGGPHWTEGELHDRMLAKGVAPDQAADQARRFIEQSQSLGVIEADDG